MSSRENIERWVSEIDEDGMCDISDNQVTALIRDYNCMAVQLANAESKCRELAVESAWLKVKGRELLKEAAYVYSNYNRMVDHLDGESIDGQTLHEFQAVIEAETTATDAFLAEMRAKGVDAAIEAAKNLVAQEYEYKDFKAAQSDCCMHLGSDFAAQLRKGAAL